MTRRVVRVALAGLVTLALVLAGPVGKAGAEDGYSYGDVSDSVTLNLTRVKFWWFECTVVGQWKVADGQQYLTVSGGCNRGALADNEDGYLFADVPDCGRVWTYLGNLDEKTETGSFEGRNLTGTGGAGSTGTDCGSPTQLCLATQSPADNPSLANGIGETRCGAWNVGPPPQEQDPWYSTGTSGCPLYTALQPWVSDYQPVAVSGGWRWESTATVQLQGYASTGTPTLEGSTAYPYVVAAASGAAGLGYVQVPVNGVSQPALNGPYAVQNWTSAAYLANPGSTRTSVRSLKLFGPVHTGTLGSTPLDVQWSGLGVYWSSDGGTVGQFSSTTSTRPESHTTRPSVASISADSGEYAAHNDPARCHFWWGQDMWPSDTSGYDAPAGPLVLRSTATPPPPVTVVTTPPVIHIGPEAECPPGADACIDPEANNPDTEPIPDPEDESCGFSITDPTTWGGQLICALVAVAKMIVEAILSVIDAIAGLLAELLELLVTLFVPDPSSWGLDGLLDQLQARPPFSIVGDLASSATTAAGQYTDGCSGGVEYEIEGIDAPALSCDTITSIPGMSEAKTVVGLAMICWTAWIVWGQLTELYKPR